MRDVAGDSTVRKKIDEVIERKDLPCETNCSLDRLTERGKGRIRDSNVYA